MSNAPVAFSLNLGAEVLFKDRRCQIRKIVDSEHVLVSDSKTKEVEVAQVRELKPVLPIAISKQQVEIHKLADSEWLKAESRLEIIRPLLDKSDRKRVDVENRAKEYGYDAATIYKWLQVYESEGRVSALLTQNRNDKGTSRLPPEVDEIITSMIESEYLTRTPKSVSRICQEIRSKCEIANLPPPHCNTVRNRIDAISEELRMSKRRGKKMAAQKYSPIKGSFPGADFPLAVVEIDHTKMDIILVDDVHRRPVGRPWITLAIDVFSRMIAGLYVSFDPPGSLSTGLCMAHAILAKDKWMVKHGVSASWPLWGLPKKIHLDNAKEFRGAMLQRACKEYGIDIEWRPVARPHFGGHIERAIGTLMKEIHTLAGTTFSNTRERGDYDAEDNARLTLSEFEKWLATFIVDVYHQREHRSLGTSPLDKFNKGIFGTDEILGSGLPEKITDEDRLRLDFMPFEERSIQNYGVVINKVNYYHDVLRRWIGVTEQDNSKTKRKFMFRCDPRDISTIWFYDPEVKEYYPIPYRNTSHPAISIWELREMQRSVKESQSTVDERAIFEAYERMRVVEIEAEGKTHAVRRASQRRKPAENAIKPTANKRAPADASTNLIPTDLTPFDELDDML